MASPQSVNVKIQVDSRKLAEALRTTSKAMGKLAPLWRAANHQLVLFWSPPADRRKHRARCPICSPLANPAPLAINGAEYHRRSSKRSRR